MDTAIKALVGAVEELVILHNHEVSEHNNMVDYLDDRDVQIALLQKQVGAHQAEMTTLKEKHAAELSAVHARYTEDTRTRAERHVQDIKNLTEELAALQSKLAYMGALEKRLEALADAENELTDSRQQIEALSVSERSLHIECDARMQVIEGLKTELAALLEKHNSAVTTANSQIEERDNELARLAKVVADQRTTLGSLEKVSANQETSIASMAERLKRYTAMNPEKIDKLNKRLKKANEELKATNEALAIANRLMKKAPPSIQSELPLWNVGRESLVNITTANIYDESTSLGFNKVVWWRHESGIQLLCGWNPIDDRVVLCDPRDENGNLVLPSPTAETAIRGLLKGVFDTQKKRKKAS